MEFSAFAGVHLFGAGLVPRGVVHESTPKDDNVRGITLGTHVSKVPLAAFFVA